MRQYLPFVGAGAAYAFMRQLFVGHTLGWLGVSLFLVALAAWLITRPEGPSEAHQLQRCQAQNRELRAELARCDNHPPPYGTGNPGGGDG